MGAVIAISATVRRAARKIESMRFTFFTSFFYVSLAPEKSMPSTA